MALMGLQFGLSPGQFRLCKRKFRWLLRIDDLCSTSAGTVNVLPPLKMARPSLTFKEMEVRHLNEHVYYPMKPEYKAVNLVLYDTKLDKHPVWEWVKKCYDAQEGTWKPALRESFIQETATLELYDGCGDVVESWVYENVWPQVNEFGELDMGSAEYLTCDLTLRYARAWVE